MPSRIHSNCRQYIQHNVRKVGPKQTTINKVRPNNPWFSITRLLLLMTYVAAGPVQAQQLEIFQLSNRPASEIVNLVQPFLSNHGTAVANGTQLIVRTDAENMVEIQQLITTFDKGLSRFRISVLQTNQLSLDELNAQASVHGTLSNKGSRIRAKGNFYQSDSKTEGQVTQQIQTMEGKAAHIQVGKAYPIPTYTVPTYGNQYPTAGISYQTATTGFAVTPRMVGNEVLLEIEPWSNRLSRRGGGIIETQSAHSTIRAPLGKWINFGGMENQGSKQTTGILQRSWQTDKQSRKIYIKVDKM